MKDILEAIVGSTNDAIVSADANGKVIGWNPAAQRIFGYEENEIVGQSLTVLVPERFRSAHEAGLSRVVRTGETRVIGQTVQVTGLHKDGFEIPIELSLATWATDGERYFSGIIRDIRKRQKIMDELAQSEERLRSIMNSVTDAIICADGSGRVVVWNPAAERMFGHAEQSMIGETLSAIVPERYRADHEAGIRRLSGGGERHVIGKTVELNALRNDGSEFPIELSLGTWTVKGQHYFSGIVRDITERKRTEAEIVAMNRTLDEKNQELEALSSKLAKYLSKQVYDSIFSGQKEVQVESYRKSLTIFFSDVQGFTEITDTMEAEPLSDLLNRYLSEMSAIAHEYGGTIDKFIGDGIMIFFGDPETQGEKEDAIACVRMALAMRRRILEMQEEWLDQGISQPLHVRIGINSGFCTVGNFGSENMLDYTIVGGQVNATARLEAAAQADQILISNTTYALVKDEIHARSVGEINVKGISQPIKTYEVISTLDQSVRGLTPISDRFGGFRLTFDPLAIAPEDRQRAQESLQAALDALEKSI